MLDRHLAFDEARPEDPLRSLFQQIEELTPVRFITLVGLAAGTTWSTPGFFLGHINVADGRLKVVAAIAIGLVSWLGAVLLWWVSVRRRRWSTLSTALQVTLALGLADVLTVALSFAVTSMETHGSFIELLAKSPSSALLGNSAALLLQSSIRFVGALLLLAVGRRLPGSAEASQAPVLRPTPEPH